MFVVWNKNQHQDSNQYNTLLWTRDKGISVKSSKLRRRNLSRDTIPLSERGAISVCSVTEFHGISAEFLQIWQDSVKILQTKLAEQSRRFVTWCSTSKRCLLRKELNFVFPLGTTAPKAGSPVGAARLPQPSGCTTRELAYIVSNFFLTLKIWLILKNFERPVLGCINAKFCK